VHFIPVHMHPYYRERYMYRREDYPVTNRIFERSISLPIYPGMSEEQVNYVTEKVLQHAR